MTDKTNPPAADEKVENLKPRIIAYSVVVFLCLFSHWYFVPNTHECTLTVNHARVSETLNLESNSWTFAPKKDDYRLAMVRGTVEADFGTFFYAVYWVARYFNTIVNINIGVWLIDYLPVLLGLGGIIDLLKTTTSMKDCWEKLYFLLFLKGLASFLVLVSQVDTCTYLLTARNITNF